MDKKKYFEDITPRYEGYQELHIHSVGSYKDAANTVEDVFDSAEEFGRNAVSITDHGNLTRLFMGLKERTKREVKILKELLTNHNVPEEEAQKILKSMGSFDTVRNPNDKMWEYIEKYPEIFVETAHRSIQFVPGIEVYQSLRTIKDENPDNNRWHLILYAKDWEGMQAIFGVCNLAELNKISTPGGDFSRVTMDTLRQFFGPGKKGHGKVIATSACMGGYIQSILLKPLNEDTQRKQLQEKIKELQKTVSKEKMDNFAVMIDFKTAHLKNLKDQYRELKKLCSRKLAEKLEKAIAKEEKTKELLDKAIEQNKNVEKARFNHEQAVEAKQAASKDLKSQENAKQQLPLHEAEIAEEKASLKTLKDAYKIAIKNYEPIEKLQAKIDAIPKSKPEDVYEEAKQVAMEYKSIFGDDFYIELQNHGIVEEIELLPLLYKLAKELNIPLTCANDVHYKTQQLKRKRDLIATMRYPGMTLGGFTEKTGQDQLYFKSNEEMIDLFKEYPEALLGPAEIAKKSNVFYKQEWHLPEFESPHFGKDASKHLRYLCNKGYKKRYPDWQTWTQEKKDIFNKRMDYELGIIDKMGFSSYISIVQDFICWGKRNFSNESIGPGRGSGAGSLVCYLIGITDIDPFVYGLYFERFLNPERVSMPDIDTDFAADVREGTIKYVTQKYAPKEPYYVPELNNTVCSIFTEGTLAARSAIRAVARITNVPLSVADKTAKLIPSSPNMTIKKALTESIDLQSYYDENSQIKSLIDDAMLIEGVPVQTGIHAAGVIIADKPITEYAPMFWNEEKQVWVIQCDMVACEGDLKLLKMDFLGLKNLDIIMDCRDFIKETTGEIINFKELNKAKDNKVIEKIYATGDTDGIFQFESGGMKKTLKEFNPSTIHDVILLNAAYRPGPMDLIPEVSAVKKGEHPAKYVVKELEPIMSETYGSPIYQEQIMRLFQEVCGYSLGEADIVRRAMSKKKLYELEAAKERFTKAFLDKGATEEETEEYWQQMLKFASYAFNKSHAAAYSIVSYYTAWLKYYYPMQYMAALLKYSELEDYGAYLGDCKLYGIKINNISINNPHIYPTPEYLDDNQKSIHLGFSNIKGVGKEASLYIQAKDEFGEYKSPKDVIVRAIIYGITKSSLSALISVGAMDEICCRKDFIDNLDDMIFQTRIAYRNCLKCNPYAQQHEIYSYLMDDQNFQLAVTFTQKDYTSKQKALLEQEYAGAFISSNPIADYSDILTSNRILSIKEEKTAEPYKPSVFTGMVTGLRTLKTKKQNKTFVSFTLLDESDTIEAVCFPGNYKGQTATYIVEDEIVKITGTIKQKDDDLQLIVDTCEKPY